MGLFNRKKVKNLVPTGFPTWFGNRASSGAIVTPDSAMRLSAVYGCVKILAEAVAELPLHTYKIVEGDKIKAYNHPLYYLLHDEPNPEMTSFNFRETMMAHLCLYGNHYSQIVRNGRGEVVGLYPLLPQNMQVYRDQATSKIFYQYTRTPGEADPGKTEVVILSSEEVLHIPGLAFDGLKGYSPLYLARNIIGASLSSEEFADKFFANAAMPSGVLEFPGTLKNPTAVSEKWGGSFSGAINSGKTPVLEEGMKYKPISISPQDAQFLETRKFNINEIARIFRVPPHMLADLEKSSFSNIEQQSLEFVKYTLAPWIARIEQSMKKALLLPSEKKTYFFSFNFEGLLRGDYASRMNGYAIARQNGWMSANDIRELENMNRIPKEEGGDAYLINGNMLPLNMAGAYADNNKEGGTQ